MKSVLYLAPMAGVADRAFRELCRENGADRTISEMISAKAIFYRDKKTLALASFGESENPFVIQLFGSDPEAMAFAARTVCERLSPAGIDINMGCPVPKVVKNGDGSALMRNPELAERITEAVVSASGVPVSVKLRSGWNSESAADPEQNAVGLAVRCERAGASLITVHARTREQGYRRGIELEMISAVKQKVKIPVIGNGDIDCASSAREMIEKTGCDGIMIGRAAVGRPWIFSQIKAELAGESFTPPRLSDVMRRHIELEFTYKPEAVAARELRRHIASYIKGCRGAAALRDRVNHLESKDELLALADELED